MSSSALNTSDAEMLLCCLDVETSCALVNSRQKNPRGASENYHANIRSSCKELYQQKGVDVDVMRHPMEHARTEVVDKHRRALD